MNKVFLIDGHAQIFRMYYAFLRRPMVNSKGVDTSILFGFTKMLLDLIKKESPTHLAVAFDPPAKTFRHQAFEQYKANRSATPELVKEALEPLQEILHALNIPVIMKPGFEADDVIGSMAKQWSSSTNQVYMVTPDKDYGQLLTNNIFQYKPAKGGSEIEIIDEKKICEQYNIIKPEQVIDILTIWGDASDNVPGIKGIGEVGAKKLISKYGSIEEVYNHIDELPTKQQEAVKAAEQHIGMSKFLITIKTDIEIDIDEQTLAISKPNLKETLEVFNKYEFSSLLKLLETDMEVSHNNANSVEAKELPAVKEAPLSFILENSNKLKEICICLDESQNIFIASGDYYSLVKNQINNLKVILEDESISKVGYQLKDIIKLCRKNNIKVKGQLFDTEIMHYIISPERSHKKDILYKTYLQLEVADFTNKQEQEQIVEQSIDLFSTVIEDNQADTTLYGIETALMWRLKNALIEELNDLGQFNLYLNIEAPLIQVLADMEYNGVKIDIEHLKHYSTILTAELKAIEDKGRELANDPFLNMSSPKQVGILLYEKLQLNSKVKKSAKGSYPTDEETLNELAGSHPIIGLILEYRGLKKLLSTYIDNFPTLIDPKTHKLHTTFNQALTATGRLSSTSPNLQNIPIRTERGREIRKAFISSFENGYIVSADYSQIELRLMAHLSGDKDLIEAFNCNRDIHTETAAKIFKTTRENVTKEERSKAKTANFGIIYGISAFGLSQRLNIPRGESKKLIDDYFENYPAVKNYMDTTINKAKEDGYVETIYGRKRYLLDINSKNAAVRSFNERNAINAPLQGSAADIIKVSMINIFNRIQQEKLISKMILQVHDELVFDVPTEEVNIIENLVVKEMENVIKLLVPLIAECGSGRNWLEAH